MSSISGVYAKIHINESFLEQAIRKAEATQPQPERRAPRRLAVACVCAAAMVLGTVALLLRSMIGPTPAPSYQTLSQFGAGATAEALQSHEGFAIWVNGVYFNGHTMYIALCGEYDRNTWRDEITPDTLRYRCVEGDGSRFMLGADGEQAARLVTEEITLTKNGRFFEGTMELEAESQDSLRYLRMSFPAIEVWGGGELLTTVSGPFETESFVQRTYTDDEKALLSGKDVLYIAAVCPYPPGAIGDYTCGLTVDFHIPAAIFDAGIDIRAAAYNEDDSEIPLTREFQSYDGTGIRRHLCYDFPSSRQIRVALYEKNGVGKDAPVQEYDVTLNEPFTFGIFD